MSLILAYFLHYMKRMTSSQYRNYVTYHTAIRGGSDFNFNSVYVLKLFCVFLLAAFL